MLGEAMYARERENVRVAESVNRRSIPTTAPAHRASETYKGPWVGVAPRLSGSLPSNAPPGGGLAILGDAALAAGE